MVIRADPPCAACSNPIRSGILVVFEHGDLFHVGCRTRSIELKSIVEVDRTQTALRSALRLIDEAKERRAARSPMAPSAAVSTRCPLCAETATRTDWRFVSEWIGVEGCTCGGFFVWAALLDGRLRNLTESDRKDLALRIRAVRLMGNEAWVTTTDATVTSPLVIRTVRPELPG